MSDNESDFASVESRRSKDSTRRRTLGRRLGYAIGLPVLRFVLFLLNVTYRRKHYLGADITKRIVADKGQAYVPCYWHQQHVICSRLMHDWLKQGFEACYIVSASVDGDVPARIAESWGAEVIRGSAAATGALVLRDAQQTMKRGVSIVATSDGPLGPRFEFKSGTVLMARIGGAPMVPVACATDRAWYLDTWDHFMIPKPFARIVVAVGEPMEVPRGASMEEIEAVRGQMQAAIDDLIQESKALLADAT